MSYDIHIENFEGPFDLLLHLIRQNNLEIAEIPIAQITAEYIAYLEALQELNLDIAGDFLVMAATLMQIKARTLLPSPEVAGDEDPVEDLKARLLEYQKFKEAAQVLAYREDQNANIFYRSSPLACDDDVPLSVSLFDLVRCFKDVLTELPASVKEIVYQEIPIEQKIREILDMLAGAEYVTLAAVFRAQESRSALISSFLAVLELIRLKQVLARQSALFDEIRIYLTGQDRPAAEVPAPDDAAAHTPAETAG